MLVSKLGDTVVGEAGMCDFALSHSMPIRNDFEETTLEETERGMSL